MENVINFQVGDIIKVQCYDFIIDAVAIGKGAFPYDCTSKAVYPDAMIFQDDTTGIWFGDYQIKKIDNDMFILL